MKKVYTYLSGPYGVFAVVVSSGGVDNVNYVYKDHLGSWTTITDSVCNIVERHSFDAWGNLRDPLTWSGSPARPPKFDRGFTGHEHIYELGLINMNGRMYDPLMSAFLSPDNYMQDPTSQQGFNRYAYCMYNPLKYVDPTGEQYFGWDPGLQYRIEQEMRGIVLNYWHQCYDIALASHHATIAMANCLFSHGNASSGISGSRNHGSPGGGNIDSKTFKEKCDILGITPGQAIPKEKWTDEFIKQFQEVFFPDAPMEYVKDFLLKDLSKGIDGKTNNIFDDDLLSTGHSDVYFNSNTDFTPESLFYAMGHELIHVSQNIETMGYPQSMLFDQSFIDVKEFWAHSWISATGGIDHYPRNDANMKFWLNQVNPLNPSIMVNYTDMMNYRHFKWLQNVIYPPF